MREPLGGPLTNFSIGTTIALLLLFGAGAGGGLHSAQTAALSSPPCGFAGGTLAASSCNAGPCAVWDWSQAAQAESNFALQQPIQDQGVDQPVGTRGQGHGSVLVHERT